MDKQVLVTGATGLLGSAIVGRLTAAGASVTAASRSVYEPGDPAVTWRPLDISAPGQIAALVAAERPDVILHLAADVRGTRDHSEVETMLAHNLIPGIEVMSAALEHGVNRVVLAGSLLQEPEAGQPPPSPYGAAKWALDGYASMFAELYGLDVVNLACAMVYGPGTRDMTKVLPYSIGELLAGRAPSLGSGSYRTDWVFVDDVADAFLLAATASNVKGARIEIGTGVDASVREVVTMAHRLIGSGPEPAFGELEDRALDVDRVASLDGARSLLGWEPQTALEGGIAATIEWMRSRLTSREHTSS